MLTWNFSEFVTRGGKEQESELPFHVYSLPRWTKFTVDFCRFTDVSEQQPIAQNWAFTCLSLPKSSSIRHLFQLLTWLKLT